MLAAGVFSFAKNVFYPSKARYNPFNLSSASMMNLVKAKYLRCYKSVKLNIKTIFFSEKLDNTSTVSVSILFSFSHNVFNRLFLHGQKSHGQCGKRSHVNELTNSLSTIFFFHTGFLFSLSMYKLN